MLHFVNNDVTGFSKYFAETSLKLEKNIEFLW